MSSPYDMSAPRRMPSSGYDIPPGLPGRPQPTRRRSPSPLPPARRPLVPYDSYTPRPGPYRDDFPNANNYRPDPYERRPPPSGPSYYNRSSSPIPYDSSRNLSPDSWNRSSAPPLPPVSAQSSWPDRRPSASASPTTPRDRTQRDTMGSQGPLFEPSDGWRKRQDDINSRYDSNSATYKPYNYETTKGHERAQQEFLPERPPPYKSSYPPPGVRSNNHRPPPVAPTYRDPYSGPRANNYRPQYDENNIWSRPPSVQQMSAFNQNRRSIRDGHGPEWDRGGYRSPTITRSSASVYPPPHIGYDDRTTVNATSQRDSAGFGARHQESRTPDGNRTHSHSRSHSISSSDVASSRASPAPQPPIADKALPLPSGISQSTITGKAITMGPPAVVQAGTATHGVLILSDLKQNTAKPSESSQDEIDKASKAKVPDADFKPEPKGEKENTTTNLTVKSTPILTNDSLDAVHGNSHKEAVNGAKPTLPDTTATQSKATGGSDPACGPTLKASSISSIPPPSNKPSGVNGPTDQQATKNVQRAPSQPEKTTTSATIDEGGSVPSMSNAKSIAEALRIVVMTRLQCDRQTREERVNPVLHANHALISPEIPKLSTEVVEGVTTGKRQDDMMKQFAKTKLDLIGRFKLADRSLSEKTDRLREEYLALHERWQAHCAKLDNKSNKKTAKESPVVTDDIAVTAGSGRSTRRTAAMLGDAVRSDLEMEQIIASLGVEELTDPNHLALRNLAKIPDMISVSQGEVKYLFDDTNNLVDDPIRFYDTSLDADSWTDAEKEIFMEQFAANPKQFGIIASFLPSKTASQCVTFYYLNKKKIIDFRKVMSLYAPGKRRRGGRRTDKQKGNALMADIRKHDDEVSLSHGGPTTRRKRVQPASARGTSSRIVASRFEVTPTTTPTPDPEPEVKKRGRKPNRIVSVVAEENEDGAAEKPKKKKPGRKPKTPAIVPDDPPTPPSESNTTDAFVRMRKTTTPNVHWSDVDKAQFLTLLSQYGDDFKRIAASMPNKTTIQVNTYFRTNLVDLRLDKVVASAPKRSPTPDGTTPVSNAKFYNSVIEDDDATRIDQTTSPINRPPSVGLPTVVASPTDQNKFSAPPSHLAQ